MSVADLKGVIVDDREETEELKRQQTGKETQQSDSNSNFWELINDVAKDLNLALQDLSPDLEISTDITNGINENRQQQQQQQASSATCISLSKNSKENDTNCNSNSILFQPTLIRIAGRDDDENVVDERRKSDRKSTSLSLEDNKAQGSLLFDSPFSPLLPLSQNNSSYSSQLLSVMSLGANKLFSPSFADAKSEIHSSQRHSPVSCSSPDPKSSSILDGSCGGDDAILSDVDGSAESIPASIGLLERLMRTHPIWFMPQISRAGVVHLLQGKEPGCFIVRQSSKPNTMALSVRLPEGKGPHVEHYLIEDAGNGKLRLEGSENQFSAVPMLICHYCQCCDELPVELVLPQVLAEASRHQLTSLALLGQDFWQSTLSKINDYNDSNSSNSMPRQSSTHLAVQENGIKLKTSPLPPAVPPKQDTTDLEPIIDPKKSSTVDVVMAIEPQITPKLPPRSMVAPPIPPRTTKLLLKQQQLLQQQEQKEQEQKEKDEKAASSSPPTSRSPCLKGERTSPAALNAPITLNDGLNAPIAPNTEVTLINLNDEASQDVICDSSQQQEERVKSPTVVNKRVLCYRSLLEEKVSDYEDIWCMTNNSSKLLPFNSAIGNVCAKYRSNNKHLEQGTQTDDEDAPTKNAHRMSSNRHLPSPFYTEPIDAIDRHNKNAPHRRSDTNINEKEGVTSSDLHPTLSKYSLESLIDNLKCHNNTLHRDSCKQHFNVKNYNIQDASIQVGNPIVSLSDQSKKNSRSIREISWPVDPTWEWLNHNIDDLPWRKKNANERNVNMEVKDVSVKDVKDIKETEADVRRSSCVESNKSDSTTIEDLIMLKDPQLTVPKVEPLFQSNLNSLAQAINSTENHSDSGNTVNDNYDNLAIYNQSGQSSQQPVQTRPPQSTSQMARSNSNRSTDTDFSETCDSEYLESIKKVFLRNNFVQLSPDNDENVTTFDSIASLLPKGENSLCGTSIPTSTFDLTEVSSLCTEIDGSEHKDIRSSVGDRSSFAESQEDKVGIEVCNYIFTLASEGSNTFSKSIDHFIRCTIESSEINPSVVMSNMRQFMNGMKNYLVKHGEGQFQEMVQQERGKLKCNEFLNIDSILEGSLHKLVIKPLKNHLYQLFVNEYNQNGSLKLLSKNIKEAQTKSATELGVRAELNPPDSKTMLIVQKNFYKLQRAYSPLKKLEYLLAAISAIYNNVRQQQIENAKKNGNASHSKPEHASFGADDFLPIFIYVLVQCGMISAEIEADYCFGLLNPSILHGEGGYYLTALSSAVNVLKNINESSSGNGNANSSANNETDDYGFKRNEAIINSDSNVVSATSCKASASSSTAGFKMIDSSSSSSITTVTSQSPTHASTSASQSRLASITDQQGYLKIMIPDELTCSIISKTLPVRPNMTTKEVCKMMAHKFKITNPEDYGLFKLINGVEAQLNENDVPQVIKSDLFATGVDCLFTYKRCDAKFIWPIAKFEATTPSN